MKAKIIINFRKIAGIKVDYDLLERTPQLLESTRKTVTILCHNLKKYFDEQKIKTKISFKLEND